MKKFLFLKSWQLKNKETLTPGSKQSKLCTLQSTACQHLDCKTLYNVVMFPKTFSQNPHQHCCPRQWVIKRNAANGTSLIKEERQLFIVTPQSIGLSVGGRRWSWRRPFPKCMHNRSQMKKQIKRHIQQELKWDYTGGGDYPGKIWGKDQIG